MLVIKKFFCDYPDEALATIWFTSFFLLLGLQLSKKDFRSDLINSMTFKDPFGLRTCSKYWRVYVALILILAGLAVAMHFIEKCAL